MKAGGNFVEGLCQRAAERFSMLKDSARCLRSQFSAPRVTGSPGHCQEICFNSGRPLAFMLRECKLNRPISLSELPVSKWPTPRNVRLETSGNTPLPDRCLSFLSWDQGCDSGFDCSSKNRRLVGHRRTAIQLGAKTLANSSCHLSPAAIPGQGKKPWNRTSELNSAGRPKGHHRRTGA